MAPETRHEDTEHIDGTTDVTDAQEARERDDAELDRMIAQIALAAKLLLDHRENGLEEMEAALRRREEQMQEMADAAQVQHQLAA